MDNVINIVWNEVLTNILNPFVTEGSLEDTEDEIDHIDTKTDDQGKVSY